MAFTSDGSALITTSPNGYLHYLPLKGGMASLKVHGNDIGGDEEGLGIGMGRGGGRGIAGGGGGGGGGEVIRDLCVVKGTEGRGDLVVSVGYDRVVRFTEVVDA